MSIDPILKYISEMEVYNKYISEFEKMSKSKDETVEKCKKLFESFRTQLEEIGPSLTSGTPPSPSQIKEVLSFLKAELNRKTTQLAKQIVQSNVELLDPKIYEEFPHALRLEIAKLCAANEKYKQLTGMIKQYEIKDQNEIFELVKIRVIYDSDASRVCSVLPDFGITDERKRLEIAKLVTSMKYGGKFVFANFDKFQISDPNHIFELVKCIAQRDPKNVFSSRSLFLKLIQDPQKRYEIYSIVASKLSIALLELSQMVNKDQLFDLTKIAAEALGIDIIQYLDLIDIKDTDQLKVIYKLCYEHAMKKLYLQNDKETIASLSFPDSIQWGFSPNLKRWLERVITVKIPEDLETETKKNEWEKEFNGLLSELIKEGVAAGFSGSRLKDLSESVILKAENPQQQLKYLIWLGDFAIRCGFEPDLKPLLEDKAAAPTFEAIFKLTNPILQVAATTALTDIYKNENKRKVWISLVEGQPKHLLLTTLLLIQQGFQEKEIRKILDSLKAKRYTDYKLMQSINEMICFLGEKSGLSMSDQTRLLEVILKEPEKEPRESGRAYQKRREEHRRNQQILLAAVPTLILFDRSELLQDIPDVNTLLDRWNSTAGEIFDIHEAEMIEKFNAMFCQSKRYPNGLLVYAGRMQLLPDIEKLAINETLRQFAKSVLDGTFPQIRYDFTNNIHLKTIFENNPSLLEKWKTPIPSIKQNGWIIEDTEQWEDLLLSGTEVSKSCQHLMDEPKLSKCLMAYILDGKNRAIVVKNKDGKIVARSILRILWDPQKKEPVLFMEQLYTSQDNPIFEKLVLEGCIQKAKSMGLQLVTRRKYHPDFTYKLTYPGALEALGGPVPFEYVDAVAVPVRAEGKFEIPISCVLFEPIV